MTLQQEFTKITDSDTYNKIYNINLIDLNNLDTLFIQYETSRTNKILDTLIQTKKTRKVKFGDVVERVNLSADDITLRKSKRKDNILKCMDRRYTENRLLYDTDSEILHNVVCCCKSKYCPHCQIRHQKTTRGRLIDFVGGFQSPRFCTVSLASTEVLTADYVRTASLEFELMRKYLKRQGFTFGNYVSVLEIVLHEKRDPYYKYEYGLDGKASKTLVGSYLRKNWNVHFHIIYDGDFIPQRLASECLQKATKGKSRYVYFEYISQERTNAIKNKTKALMYITKYITKQQVVSPNVDRLLEYYTAIKNIKMVRVCGYKSVPKTKKLKDYIKNLMDSGIDYHEACTLRNLKLEVMKDFSMKKYDITLSLDENCFLYSDKLMLDICIGV